MSERWLVTGGAGFIGSALVAELLQRGDRVTVLDDLSTADPDCADALEEAAHAAGGNPLRYVPGDIRDLAVVTEAIADHDVVAHLAASTDIAGGYDDPRADLEGCVIATWNVLEAMRRSGTRRVLYASSGVVYGNPSHVPTREDHGPLPTSHYAAGKLAGEALVSGFAHLYGWRALAFRFGNTVGERSNHGIVHDLVVKLVRDPTRLDVLGDGRARKPYVAVEDVVAAMLRAETHAPAVPMQILNVAAPGTLAVSDVAAIVIRAVGAEKDRVAVRFGGGVPGGGGWQGDTTLIDFDTAALQSLGWHARWSGADAVARAAAGLYARLHDTAMRRELPLLTSLERRALQSTRHRDGPAASAGRAGP